MLSDAIREARQQLAGYLLGGIAADPIAVAAAITALDTWAIEATNMEARLALLAGRSHVPLALSTPAPKPDGGTA